MRPFAGWLLAGWMLASGAAQAQGGLSFERAMKLSLAGHPAILGKRSEQSAALADKEGAEWARYPTPTLEASTRAVSGANYGLLQVDQPLWTGGRITAGIEAATSRYGAATAAVGESRFDIATRVVSAYAETLRQKERERYARSNADEHRKLLEMIKRRVAQNVSSQIDERLAESRLIQAENDLSLIAQALKNGLAQLSQLAGEPVTDVLWEGFETPPGAQSLDMAMQSALAASPTLARLRGEEEAANADIAVRRSVYMPQLALRFEQTMGGTNADSRAMLVMTAQPGAGLSAGAGVDAAIALREAVRQTRAAAERELGERVTLDWNEWTAARLRLETARQASDMSGEVFESYARQYVIGRKTWLDVLNAVRENAQVSFALADARAQTAAASLRLNIITGNLQLAP